MLHACLTSARLLQNLIDCSQYGNAGRFSDPSIGVAVNELAQKGAVGACLATWLSPSLGCCTGLAGSCPRACVQCSCVQECCGQAAEQRAYDARRT